MISVSSHIPHLLVRIWPLTLSSCLPVRRTLLGALPWYCPWSVLSIWAIACARVSFAFRLEICWITTDPAGGPEISWILPALLPLLAEVCSIDRDLILIAGWPEGRELFSLAGCPEVCAIGCDLISLSGSPDVSITSVNLVSLASGSEVSCNGGRLLSLAGFPEVPSVGPDPISTVGCGEACSICRDLGSLAGCPDDCWVSVILLFG